MQYTTLGKTNLRVSVAGLGTGGFSRLGLKTGKIRGRSRAADPRGRGARHQLHRHRGELRHRRRGRQGAQNHPARSGRHRHQGAIPRQAIRAAGEGGRGARQFAAPDGHRLCRRVQSAWRGGRRIRLRAEYDCAGAARRKAQGQDPAHRHHREPDHRFHQRDAEARGARSGLGGVHGGLPHDAPGRAPERVSGHARRRASARC